ncbi:MAG: response regulator [bacterium]
MAKGTVLIVDDNPNMTALLVEMFELLHHSCKEAGDGNAALDLIDSNNFDLVVTDLKMPQMSGVELLQAIKDRRPKLPVVVISGYNVRSSEGKVLEGLADEFLNKPFKIADIQSLAEKYL